MLSMAIQTGFNNAFSYSSFLSEKPIFTPSKTTLSIKSKSNFMNNSPTIIHQRATPIAMAAPETLTADTETLEQEKEESTPTNEIEESKVEVDEVKKPRLVLRFIWMEKNIGLALDQVVPGHGAIPLSPYFFWPRKDAWEELKTTLESKPWVSQKKMIILLNQATDIINLWQQSGGNLNA